ncbi:uncharacterized protein LOC124409213 [Diprion similis]|uniref:uncharacterized protein LOC124409213 n=1 Tax=Diprion similis TaxID=362088 RepID=UPI001EF77166|nr:uncharacterized protein LOC124409213 [Diprion similis]
MARHDKELEQINIKHSIGGRKNRQHASREDILRMTKKNEEAEYDTCGIGSSSNIRPCFQVVHYFGNLSKSIKILAIQLEAEYCDALDLLFDGIQCQRIEEWRMNDVSFRSSLIETSEIPDIFNPAQCEMLRNWDGELRYLPNFKFTRFGKNHLLKATRHSLKPSKKSTPKTSDTNLDKLMVETHGKDSTEDKETSSRSGISDKPCSMEIE